MNFNVIYWKTFNKIMNKPKFESLISPIAEIIAKKAAQEAGWTLKNPLLTYEQNSSFAEVVNMEYEKYTPEMLKEFAEREIEGHKALISRLEVFITEDLHEA